MSKQPKTRTKTESLAKPATTPTNYLQWAFIFIIGIWIFIAFKPILDSNFINYDDDLYITENPLIQSFNGASVKKLFTTYYYSQYSPIAMSIMGIETQLFGAKAYPFKCFSLFLHIVNAILVFLLLRRLKINEWVCFFTALLYGIHTVQVESVAWLAASFKVSSFTFFFLLGLLSYVKYIEAAKNSYKWLALLFFILSCGCKEQAVTYSITLLIIDYFLNRNLKDKKLWIEKWPFFLVSLIFGIITIASTTSLDREIESISFGIGHRIVFAFYDLGFYIANLIWPSNLSFFYFYPNTLSIPSLYYVYIIGFIVLSILAYLNRSKRWVTFSYLFFVVNLGITIASQVMAVRSVIAADRYLYLPAIGWFLFLCLLVHFIILKYPKLKYGFVIAALVYCFFLSVLSYSRALVFKDSGLLFTDVINKYNENGSQNIPPLMALAYVNRGQMLKSHGKSNEAMKDYEKALQINPKQKQALLNIGNIHFANNQDDKAMDYYNKVLAIDSKHSKAYSNRGSLYGRAGNLEAALSDLNKSIEYNPLEVNSYTNRSLVHEQMGSFQKAINDLLIVAKSKPLDADIINSLASCYLRVNKPDLALVQSNRAIGLAPNKGNQYIIRAEIFMALNRINEARNDVNKAIGLGFNPSPELLSKVGL